MVYLFRHDANWKALSKERPKELISEITSILTAYGRDGYYDELGAVRSPGDKRFTSAEFQTFRKDLAAFAKESSGAISVSDTPSYFVTAPKYLPSTDYEPDMTFLEWMVSSKVDLELESREEWDMEAEFVLMKEAGQVKYAKIGGAEAMTRNDEWGSGIHIKWTWFETNQFGIKMNRLAPKFKYNYFNQMSDIIYAQLVATIVTAEAYDSNVIRTINNGIITLARTQRTFNVGKDHDTDVQEVFTRPKFPTARFRIVAPIELMWVMELALTAKYEWGFWGKVLDKINGITYTTKLTNPLVFYILVDRWEQNEVNTRIELEAHGPVDDIETFSQKATYRGAYGSSMDATSGLVITLPSDFIIGECCSPVPPS